MANTKQTLSDALRNAGNNAMAAKAKAALDIRTPSPINEVEPYFRQAIHERGGKITDVQDALQGNGVFTTITFNRGTTEEYTETAFTDVRYIDMSEESLNPERFSPLRQGENAVEQALSATVDELRAEGVERIDAALEVTGEPIQVTSMPFAVRNEPDGTFYTDPLRSTLAGRLGEIRAEIERLARLTENAMKAESAIYNALSSLDRDGV